MLLTEEDLGTDLYETLRGRAGRCPHARDQPRQRRGCDGLSDGDGGRRAADARGRRGQASACDLPAVTLDVSGAPTITPTGTEPPTTLVAQPLIRGAGQQVAATDVVTVQYTGFGVDHG